MLYLCPNFHVVLCESKPPFLEGEMKGKAVRLNEVILAILSRIIQAVSVINMSRNLSETPFYMLLKSGFLPPLTKLKV